MAIEHLTESVSVQAVFFLILLVNLHHTVNRGLGGSTSRHSAVPFGTEVIGSPRERTLMLEDGLALVYLWLRTLSRSRRHRHIIIRLFPFLAASLLFFLPVESILNPCQQNGVVLANVFLIADGDLVTLIIHDGLEHAIRVQIFLLTQRH